MIPPARRQYFEALSLQPGPKRVFAAVRVCGMAVKIGLPLQTTTPPPIPVNKATPYVVTTEPGMAASDASNAAHQGALYEEEQRKIHEAEAAAAAATEAANAEANQLPPPLSAENPGWWCGGEYGECTPEEGGEGGTAGGGEEIRLRLRRLRAHMKRTPKQTDAITKVMIRLVNPAL